MNNMQKNESASFRDAHKNSLRRIREDRMMSKAELARKANVTVQTIDRIEKGKECRLDTKRKIILALGFELADKDRIFADNSSPGTEPKRGGSKFEYP